MKNISKLTKVSEFRLKLYPKDFSKMRQFYEEKLGFKVVHQWGGETRGVMFKLGTTILEIVEGRAQSSSFRGTGVSLEVKDVHKLWEEFKSYKKTIHKLRRNQWGDVSFSIADPEGFKVTFFTKIKK